MRRQFAAGMNDRHDVTALSADFVDDAVRTHQNLAEGIDVEFRNLPAGPRTQ